jgi:energy-coupling factor transporter transmembrane protein EcfT
LIFNFDGVEHAVIASIKNGIITDEQNKYWHKSIVIKPFFIALAASLLAIILMFYASKLPNKYLRGLFQLGGFYVGLAVIIPFAESASQVREVHGKYYAYILIVFAISYKIIKKLKSKQANKKNQADA